MASNASAIATICAPSGDGVTRQPVRVAPAVPSLVVVADQVHVVLDERDGLEDLHSFQRVLLDDLELGGGEGLGASHDAIPGCRSCPRRGGCCRTAGIRSPTPEARARARPGPPSPPRARNGRGCRGPFPRWPARGRARDARRSSSSASSSRRARRNAVAMLLAKMERNSRSLLVGRLCSPRRSAPRMPMTRSSAIRGQTMKELGRKSARIRLVGIQARRLHVADEHRLLPLQDTDHEVLVAGEGDAVVLQPLHCLR